MRIKLDENFGTRAADLLRSAGHDVETVPAEGLCQATDRELAATCCREERCLVSLDLDFGNPLLFNPADHKGLVVVRLRAQTEAADIDRALRVLIEALSSRSVAGKLWIVESDRLREYQPDN